jgi:membrane-associated phospholipid phosphatase
MGTLTTGADRYRVRMRGRGDWLLAVWLGWVAVAQLAAFEVLRRLFVDTVRGQQLDTAALAGNDAGQGHLNGLVANLLNAVSALSVVTATLVIGFIALIRGRVLLAAVAILMILGANLTTQLVKALSDRPEFGVDVARAAAGNSLPSGHTTVVASVAVALVLVLPAALRGAAALIGAGVAALAGVATLSAGWHRPSDAVAALLVVGAWAALAGLVLVVLSRARGSVPEGGGRDGHRVVVLALLLLGTALLVVAGVAMVVTDQVRGTPPETLSQMRLLVAYAGGAAGIAAVASVVVALVLATVHRVVPHRA